MIDTLAADAAEIELTADGAPFVEDQLRAAVQDGMRHELAVRDALLELARLTREVDDVDTLKRQIVERYDTQLKKKTARMASIRDSLKVYAERFGKASFPDVGGIHLSTKDKGGKLTVVDAIAFEDWLGTTGREDLLTFKDAPLDVTKTLQLVVDEFDVRATPDGKVVNVATGEDVTEKWAQVGVQAVAETKSLAVRKS